MAFVTDFVPIGLYQSIEVLLRAPGVMADQLGKPSNRDGLQRQLHVQDVLVPVCQHVLIHLLHCLLQVELRDWYPREVPETGRRKTRWMWGWRLPIGLVYTAGDYYGRSTDYWQYHRDRYPVSMNNVRVLMPF